MRSFLFLKHFKALLVLLILLVNFNLYAFESYQPRYLELDILNLTTKDQNILEYNLSTKETVFESSFKNKVDRPFKNQMLLVKLLKDPKYKDTVYNLLHNIGIDRIRMVYCNTYAVFFMKGEKIVHTFFLTHFDGTLTVKSFQG